MTKKLLHRLFHKNSVIIVEGHLYCYGCNDYINRSK